MGPTPAGYTEKPKANSKTAFQKFRAACLHSRNPCLRFMSIELHHIMEKETLISQFFSSSLQYPVRLKYQMLIRDKQDNSHSPSMYADYEIKLCSTKGTQQSQLCSSFSHW